MPQWTPEHNVHVWTRAYLLNYIYQSERNRATNTKNRINTRLRNSVVPTDSKWESLLTPREEDLEHEQEAFKESLADLLETNANIPRDVHCNLLGSKVTVPANENNVRQMRHAKVNFVPHKYILQTDENVKRWLTDGHIQTNDADNGELTLAIYRGA
ncbi:hypothetical protein SARC_03329 [Sphaeroforma arctica JP610]|uniref:Uncharacterized protein n=1 Tax=Sphaeroforma arctica JP610 TaxID=667725 RepID=A0A0L0G610_9EUKA|nr:hypothetical protein SARC_03329 [Sphaeroforma arctica JP610]KNC84465.1 hypothetical protein SARC_03329 [Sphaeroforma arctica JP610]|eukprot:XP_014158367.1 hypothetical protein SARC_03329 [Sphaeroforma arctica JP610]